MHSSYRVAVSHRPAAKDQVTDIAGKFSRRTDRIAIVIALILIAVSAIVGRVLLERGLQLVLPSPPLLAFWSPHVGWGTPLAVMCVLIGLRLQGAAHSCRGHGCCWPVGC